MPVPYKNNSNFIANYNSFMSFSAIRRNLQKDWVWKGHIHSDLRLYRLYCPFKHNPQNKIQEFLQMSDQQISHLANYLDYLHYIMALGLRWGSAGGMKDLTHLQLKQPLGMKAITTNTCSMQVK